MKILKNIVIVIAAIVTLLAIIDLLLPNESYVDRTITVNPSPTSTYEEISDLGRSNKWSP